MATRRRFERSSLAFYAVVGICLAVWAAFAFAHFGKIFLLVEYRQWSAPGNLFNPLTIFDPRHMFDTNANSIVRSRGFAFFIAPLVGTVCGTSSPCHDAFQILLILASAFLFAAMLRALFPDAPLTLLAGSMIFLLCTEVMLDALIWQATLHDKLSLFFTALALYLVARLDLTRTGRRAVLTSNLVILLVVAAGYNTKEGVLPLLPSMLMLLAIRCLAVEPAISRPAVVRAVRRTLTWLAAPAAYGFLHLAVVVSNRVFLNPGEAARVMGGSWTENVWRDIIYMLSARPLAESLGKFPSMSQSEIDTFLWVAALVALAFGVAVACLRGRGVRLYWLWAAVSFAMAIAIPARTTTAPPFYLLVPTFYLSVWVFVTALAFVRGFPARTAALVTQALFAVVVAWHVAGFAESTTFYFHIATMSDNFEAALGRLGAQLQRTPQPAHVDFWWPQDERRSYMFFANPPIRRLAEFILPPGLSAMEYGALDAAISDRPYAPDAEPHPAAAPDTISIVLGPDLQLRQFVPPSR